MELYGESAMEGYRDNGQVCRMVLQGIQRILMRQCIHTRLVNFISFFVVIFLISYYIYVISCRFISYIIVISYYFIDRIPVLKCSWSVARIWLSHAKWVTANSVYYRSININRRLNTLRCPIWSLYRIQVSPYNYQCHGYLTTQFNQLIYLHSIHTHIIIHYMASDQSARLYIAKHHAPSNL